MSERGEQKMSTMMMDEEREAWLAIRKEAARQIDPETAEVMWQHVVIGDPYDLYPLPEPGDYNIGRGYFARSPGSDVWVSFYDLPKATREALWKKDG
jgi:hypothetical protein